VPRSALDAALECRRPLTGCIHHAVRGAQYASRGYRTDEAGLVRSVSRGGNPYDDARAERLMKTLKDEKVSLQRNCTMGDVLTPLRTCLEDTNNTTRVDAAVGLRPPVCGRRSAASPHPLHLGKTPGSSLSDGRRSFHTAAKVHTAIDTAKAYCSVPSSRRFW
jgi:transposase InsO family protein